MIRSYFFSNIGVMLGRPMRYLYHGMGSIIAIAVMPVAIMMLFVYMLGSAILAFEEVFLFSHRPEE